MTSYAPVALVSLLFACAPIADVKELVGPVLPGLGASVAVDCSAQQQVVNAAAVVAQAQVSLCTAEVNRLGMTCAQEKKCPACDVLEALNAALATAKSALAKCEALRAKSPRLVD